MTWMGLMLICCAGPATELSRQDYARRGTVHLAWDNRATYATVGREKVAQPHDGQPLGKKEDLEVAIFWDRTKVYAFDALDGRWFPQTLVASMKGTRAGRGIAFCWDEANTLYVFLAAQNRWFLNVASAEVVKGAAYDQVAVYWDVEKHVYGFHARRPQWILHDEPVTLEQAWVNGDLAVGWSRTGNVYAFDGRAGRWVTMTTADPVRQVRVGGSIILGWGQRNVYVFNTRTGRWTRRRAEGLRDGSAYADVGVCWAGRQVHIYQGDPDRWRTVTVERDVLGGRAGPGAALVWDDQQLLIYDLLFEQWVPSLLLEPVVKATSGAGGLGCETRTRLYAYRPGTLVWQETRHAGEIVERYAVGTDLVFFNGQHYYIFDGQRRQWRQE